MKLVLVYIIIFSSCLTYGQEYKKMISEGTYSLSEIQNYANNYFNVIGKSKGSGYKQYKRWEYNAKRMQLPNGEIRTNDFQAKAFEEYNASINAQQKMSYTTGDWEQLGPEIINSYTISNPGVGRITSMALDPNNNDVLIIGAENGGIWKTTDTCATWTPLNDQFLSMAVYALTIDPTNSNTYFWGSDEGRIYKSTDAGATWTSLGTLLGYVNKIIVNPINANIMYATSDYGGVFKSTDGGVTWDSITNEGEGLDVEFHPTNSDIIYATGNDFNRSVDGGNTWTIISGFGSGLKQIGVSPADPNVVYVIEEEQGAFSGFYVSTDNGASFTKKPHPNKNYFGYDLAGDDQDGQAPRDMAIAVSNTNINEVHIAGINTWRTMDGGTTFSITSDWVYDDSNGLGYCHADVDDLYYYGSNLFAVTDGGIYKASNPSGPINDAFYTDKSTGLGIHQFYKIGVSQANTDLFVGGSQDNGSSIYSNGTWVDWLESDAMETFVDKNNSNIIYGELPEGVLNKSIDGGATVIDINSHNQYGSWVTPFEQDPTTQNTIYAGYNEVYKSVDGGVNWSTISQSFPAPLELLKIANSDNKTMYAAYEDKLFKTTTASGNWTTITGFSGYINSIAIHPTDPNKVAIATSSSDKVYVTVDGGVNWSVKKTGLPDFPALALVWQNNTDNGLYVGMNYGVFYIDDLQTQWTSFSNLLPNAIINELEINYITGEIYAATYGRGAWKSNVYSNTPSDTKENEVLNSITVLPNPASSTINVNCSALNNAEVRLFNNNGQLVYIDKKVVLDHYKINVRKYTEGLYYLRINSSLGVVTKKIIIKNN